MKRAAPALRSAPPGPAPAQGCTEGVELLVDRLSQNEIDAVSVAQVVYLRGAEVRVAPQADVHPRPDHNQMIQHTLEDRRGLAASEPATGTQQGRDQLARVALVEVDGQVAIVVMVGVEQRQLL